MWLCVGGLVFAPLEAGKQAAPLQAPVSPKAGLRSSPTMWVCIPAARRGSDRAGWQLCPQNLSPGQVWQEEGAGAVGAELLGAASSTTLAWEHLRRQLTCVAVTNKSELASLMAGPGP